MKNTLSFLAIMALLLTSCNREPTLQKYFVEKSEVKDFMAVDIAPSIINTSKLTLSAEEKTALASLHNINVLAFKLNGKNNAEYEKEKTNVKTLLKTDHYDELMKFNNGTMGASVNTKGEGQHIEEFVVFVNEADNGFGVVRVVGKDMTPNNVMTIVSLLQKSDMNIEQLKPLKQMMMKNRT
jgi:hypothetical protein